MSDKLEQDYEKYQQMLEQFRQSFDEHHPEIQAKLAAAGKLIAEAEEIAEKHGLPFRPKAALLGFRMSYIPDSMEKKWPGLESDDWTEIANAWGGYDYSGWQASQTC